MTATAQKAALLEITPGAALLVIQRISYTTNSEPVYMQERYYRPDRVQYRVSLEWHHLFFSYRDRDIMQL